MQVVVLTNGNFVVTDPSFDVGAVQDVGAVDLYDGATLALISRLTGSVAGDQVGSGGVTTLANGHFVASSPAWDNSGAANAGAVTWGNGARIMAGPISAANSVRGTAAGGGPTRSFAFNAMRNVLVIGRPADNIVAVATLSWPLSAARAGSWAGSVTSSPAAIDCGATCVAQVPDSRTISLTATPAANSTLGGWSGACSGTGLCVATMDAAKSVTATFALKQFNVDLSPVGTGGTISVTVVSTPTQGATGADAALLPVRVGAVGARYPLGTVLDDTAVPAAGYTCVEWGGALSGTANPQELTVTGPITITAIFKPSNVHLPYVHK